MGNEILNCCLIYSETILDIVPRCYSSTLSSYFVHAVLRHLIIHFSVGDILFHWNYGSLLGNKIILGTSYVPLLCFSS